MWYTLVPMIPKGFSPPFRFGAQIIGCLLLQPVLETMSLPRKSTIIVISITFVVLACSATLIAQQQFAEEGVPFLYPDPRTVGVRPYIMQGKPAGTITRDRVAGITEQERQERIQWEQHQQAHGLPGYDQPPCPLCVNDPATPCKTCKMCVAGFPCENTLCRHCVQPRSKNMGNSCDLTAGDEPCGTCDSCREHRSDPCEHADSGYGPRGEFNPYREPRFMAVIPRPILDFHNNGARKFPVYYNPAPYYRPTWNPSTLAGYARPFTFRWSCGLCFRDPCGCNIPGIAGQVSYAYACKFCNRNPCACTIEICDVTKRLDPIGVAKALANMRGDETEEPLPAGSPGESTSLTPETDSDNGGIQVGNLFQD